MARRFLSPAPEALLRGLVARGALTAAEAELAAHVPVAEDVTVEADSGGHTDNRPLAVLLPEIARLRDEVAAARAYARPIRLGAAGGLGTPEALAGAFALGADFVLTGSVNQAAVESGLSDEGKAMLAQADAADVTMAPAADMFEMGVKVQVLARGTLFAPRARKLWELFSRYDALEAIPADVRARIEEGVLGATLDEVWEETRAFWSRRDPGQVERAEREPRHRMALVFRWYLGSSSRWAIAGTPGRRADYQIWCGPAMGAFNAWTAGSFLAEPRERGVVPIALNLLEGAAVVTRARQLRPRGPARAGRGRALPSAPALLSRSPLSERSPVMRRDEPVAIVGMGALFPGSSDVAGFWRDILAGATSSPTCRRRTGSLEDYYDPDPGAPDKTYARRGAFLDPVDFDPMEFGIPPNSLPATDTAQLLALVVAQPGARRRGPRPLRRRSNRDRISVILGVASATELRGPHVGPPAAARCGSGC